MRVSKEQLSVYKPLNNTVLVKIKKPNEDTIDCGEGKELYIETSYEPSQHMTVWGEIKAIPDSLYYKRGSLKSMDWDTEIEVKIGDKVCFCYLAAALALGKLNDPLSEVVDPKVIECEDELFIILNYTDLILVNNNDEVKMINGWVLLEEHDEEEVKSKLIFIPNHIRKKKSVRYAIVAHKGSLIKEYWNEMYGGDNFDVEIGDFIVFEKFHNIELEVELHSRLKKKYFRMQRKDILAIIKK